MREKPPCSGNAEPVSELVRVAPGALIVGKPLPWTVYDADGGVLLKQGHVIHSDSQLEQLFDRGLFYPRAVTEEASLVEEAPESPRLRNPFAAYTGLLRTLEVTNTAITSRDETARHRVLGLARLVDQFCQRAPDACLALVHLYAVEPTATEQTLFYAIICHFTARELGMDEKRIVVLMAAALTANLALQPFLDKLNASPRALTDQQRSVIRKHPELAIRALQDAGIGNRLLLKIIEQHHEQPDGSGYPAQLEDDRILAEARILALAERYTAMITRRAYRRRYSIEETFKSIRDAGNNSPRPQFNRALLAALTAYPPGSLVRLASNEVAVITRRAGRQTEPVTQAIIGPDGRPYRAAILRDCGLLDYNIRCPEVMDMLPSMDFGELWGFHDDA